MTKEMHPKLLISPNLKLIFYKIRSEPLNESTGEAVYRPLQQEAGVTGSLGHREVQLRYLSRVFL